VKKIPGAGKGLPENVGEGDIAEVPSMPSMDMYQQDPAGSSRIQQDPAGSSRMVWAPSDIM